MTMFQTIIQQQTSKLTMKEFIYGALISIGAILTPIVPFVTLVGLFVLFDTGLGIYVTISKFGLASFRSNKFFNVIIKSVYYSLGIILAYLIDVHIFGGALLGISLLSTKVISLLAIYSEFKSIDENQMKLGNRSLWVQFKEMIEKGKELKKDLGDLIDDDKKDEEPTDSVEPKE